MAESRAITIAAGIAIVMLVGLRIWTHSDSMVLGAPGGEVWGHVWVQWWHAQAFPEWPDGPGSWLVHSRPWPVIDPLPTWIAAALATVLGTPRTWNLMVLSGVAVAFLGGARLARSEGGDPIIGGAALSLAPAFLGSVASGLGEDVWVGVAALALSMVGATDLRRALMAGLALGVLANCGLVVAWSAALVAIGLGIAAIAQRGRSVLPGLVGGALVAGVLALPAAWLQGERLLGAGHRAGTVVARAEPLWRLNPWQGVDLASFWVPGPVDPGDALVRMHPGYLGWSLLLLALAAGRNRWWAVLGVALVLAPGPQLSFAGEPLGISNPAVSVLAALPFGSLVNHHGRLLLMGAMALAVLAAVGATRVPRVPRWLLRGAVLADLALCAPVGAPLPVTEITPPEVIFELSDLPEGPVLVLPAAGPGVHFQKPLLTQMVHQRPLLLDPNHPGLPPSFARTPSGRFLSTLAAPQTAPAPPVVDWPPDVALVVATGVAVERLTAVWGVPLRQRADSAVWSRQGAQAAPIEANGVP